jgi:hypothetical protein
MASAGAKWEPMAVNAQSGDGTTAPLRVSYVKPGDLKSYVR